MTTTPPRDPTLAGCGEDALIADLLSRLPVISDDPTQSGVIAGADAADDCAILSVPRQPELWQLLKTDCVIEGVHFLPGTEPARVGWKALARVVSDFAAMGGGQPRHALVTVAWHPQTALAWAQGLYDGLGRAAEAFGVAVVGGETARSPGPAFISIALSGEIARERCVRRGGGRPGDVLFVTGTLGGSFASGHHLDFLPRLTEARWLTAHFPVHAMMDLSDGLAKDLPRLARASGCGFRLNHRQLPCAPGCAPEAALNEGEDYELLLAVAPGDADNLESAWQQEFPRVAFTRVGELTLHGQREALGGGYDHFA